MCESVVSVAREVCACAWGPSPPPHTPNNSIEPINLVICCNPSIEYFHPNLCISELNSSATSSITIASKVNVTFCTLNICFNVCERNEFIGWYS